MGRPIGRCRLCLTDNVELCDSHILPKFGYKRVRPEKGGGPVRFDGKVAVQTDAQLTEYLLCRKCEDRFMKVETRWAPLVYKDGKFPIQDELGEEIGKAPDLARELGSVSREDAIYLAASVVWRGSVCSQLTPNLGKYEDEFRRFLLGEAAFPQNAEVMLSILGEQKSERFPEMYQVLVPPWMEREGGCHFHRFILCGCLFAVWVGARLPTTLEYHGLVRGSQPLVLVGNHDGVVQLLAEQVASSRPKGKLARSRNTPRLSSGDRLLIQFLTPPSKRDESR